MDGAAPTGQEGAVVALGADRGQPEDRQAADRPDVAAAERPGRDPGRQAQTPGQAVQVVPREDQVLPAPAAPAAAGASERKVVPRRQQGHIRGAAAPLCAAEVDRTVSHGSSSRSSRSLPSRKSRGIRPRSVS